jgi:hypothetical protein
MRIAFSCWLGTCFPTPKLDNPEGLLLTARTCLRHTQIRQINQQDDYPQ